MCVTLLHITSTLSIHLPGETHLFKYNFCFFLICWEKKVHGRCSLSCLWCQRFTKEKNDWKGRNIISVLWSHHVTMVTFSRWGQGRGAGLGVAEEHLLVEASQGMVGGVCVLLDKDVAGWHDVHHYHFNCHSTGEQELRGQMTSQQRILLQ